jgi:hypothetical protein
MHAFRIIGMALLLVGCASTTSRQQPGETLEVALAAPGAPKERIFDLTRSWITGSLRAEAKGIESENRQEGKLVAHATIPYPCGADCTSKHGWEVPFKMRVDIQDARLNVAFSNVRLTWPEYSYRPAYDGPVQPYGSWDAVKARLSEIANELQQAVVSPRG